MGYDLHITRAVPWYRYRRYPILAAEVREMVQHEPDLTIAPEELDAWVIGDEDEKYQYDGHEVISQEPDPADLPPPAYLLTRHRTPGGMNWDRPILEQEWIDLAASQPDFTLLTRVEAKLPSGLRWIACPPMAYWTAHPSGKPVPFFFDGDLVEVADPDPATVQRMLVLATALAAKVMDEDDNHITA